MFNSKKGCLIKFTNTTNGLFEIITPVMDGDELFDANLLEQTITNLISQGKRNFALDLSNIEYIYSDSINKFINLNHKVLNIYGRLSLLSPQEEVAQILQRAGIQNFITIHDSQESLMQASQEMIQQTTTINVADVQNQQAPQPPKSEFDDLRSEIGNAMDIDAPATEPETSTLQINPQQTQQNDSAFVQQQPVVAPQYEQPAPQMPQMETTSVPVQPATQPVAEQISPEQPQADFAQNTHSDEIPEFGNDVADQYADRFEEEESKKSSGLPVGVLILLIVSVFAVLAVGAFLIMGKSKSKTAVMSTTPVKKVVEKKTDLPELKEVPDMDDPALAPKKAPVKKTSVASTTKRTPTRKRVVKKKSYTKTKKPTTKSTKKVAKTNTATKGGIVITSSPSGAKVLYNNKVLGVTPYTWSGSLPYGMIALTVVKDGYKEKRMNFEYTGDATKKNFVLTAKPKASKSVASKPAATKPVATSTPKTVKSTPTPVAKPATPAGKPGTIFISSLPPMADVYMDGVKIGKTNIAELKVVAGAHEMKFVKGAKTLTKKMSFTPGLNKSQLIRLK